MSRSEQRRYLDPYLAGTLLGVLLFASFYVTGGGLGASGALTQVHAGVLRWFAPEHVDRVGYLADIAGGTRDPWHVAGVYMLIGTVLGGLLSGIVNRRFKLELRKGPRISAPARIGFALLGGAIMGFGARLARGCTSGQALSGGAVLSVGSWAFALSVFAGGYLLAWSLRRLWT
jgi:hypothetical protein